MTVISKRIWGGAVTLLSGATLNCEESWLNQGEVTAVNSSTVAVGGELTNDGSMTLVNDVALVVRFPSRIPGRLSIYEIDS